MSDLIKAARQALEALCRCTPEQRTASDALRAALAQEREREPQYTTGHCKERAKPNGCQLHNLNCGYPECDRKAVALKEKNHG